MDDNDDSLNDYADQLVDTVNNNKETIVIIAMVIIALIAIVAIVISIVSLVSSSDGSVGATGPAGPPGPPGLNPYQYSLVNTTELNGNNTRFAPNTLTIVTGGNTTTMNLTLNGSNFSVGDTMTIHNLSNSSITLMGSTDPRNRNSATIVTVSGNNTYALSQGSFISLTVARNISLGINYWLIPN